MKEIIHKISIMLFAVVIHLTLFIGLLFILLEISRPWLVTIAASIILSQLFFMGIVIASLALSFLLYIKIGQFIMKKLS